MRLWRPPVLVLATVNFISLGFAQRQATELHLAIVEGDGAVNNLRARTSRVPIVQVTDQNHRPVVGAVVSFQVIENGAGGAFKSGAAFKTVTDGKGLAKAVGFRPNAVPGSFQIHVAASFQGHLATAVITQTNVLASTAPAAGATAGVSSTASGGSAASSAAGGAAGAGGAGAAGAAAAGISTGGIVAIAGGVAAAGAVGGVVAADSSGNSNNSNTQTSAPTGTIGAPSPPTIGPAIAFSRSHVLPVTSFFLRPGSSGYAGGVPALLGRLATSRFVKLASGHFSWADLPGSRDGRRDTRSSRK